MEFDILTKKYQNFTTESVRTEPININLEEHYYDDFIPVDKKIKSSFKKSFELFSESDNQPEKFWIK